MSKFGVIDLGTNTFHLLISEVVDGKISTLYRKRIFIQLAEDGIEKIGIAPFQRGLTALREFSLTLSELKIQQVKAFGTAALRTASNGTEFIQRVLEETQIKIDLIPGSEEARLIHKGVIQALPFDKEKNLIMDIGGGSVEFIIADQDGVIWAESFPIGVAVLYNRFHKNEPITPHELHQIDNFLEEQLAPLLSIHKKYDISKLVGASGTFDVLENILVTEKTNPLYSFIQTEAFFPIYQAFLQTNLEQRLQMKEIPETRAKLIIVALALIHFILVKIPVQQIAISAYAMKEGMLLEMVEQGKK